jgi:DNA-binding XRE family transcriptional regulator
MVKRVMRALLEDEEQEDAAGHVTPEEAFGPRSPARALRGYRYREALTQAQLATLVGVTAQNISDMECGRRGIGKEMAKKLGEALNAPWARFL